MERPKALEKEPVLRTPIVYSRDSVVIEDRIWFSDHYKDLGLSNELHQTFKASEMEKMLFEEILKGGGKSE